MDVLPPLKQPTLLFIEGVVGGGGAPLERSGGGCDIAGGISDGGRHGKLQQKQQNID